jgi:hypothetical protein
MIRSVSLSSTPGMLEWSTIPTQMMTGPIILKAASKAHIIRECSKLPRGHQPREADEGGTSEEGMVINPGDFSAFCGEDKGHTTRMCQVMIQKKRKSLKPKHGRTSRSSFCIRLHVIPHISLNMWAISNLWRPLLRRVIPKPPGLSCHHHWLLPWSITNSQKGIARRSNNAILGRSLKFA